MQRDTLFALIACFRQASSTARSAVTARRITAIAPRIGTSAATAIGFVNVVVQAVPPFPHDGTNPIPAAR